MMHRLHAVLHAGALWLMLGSVDAACGSQQETQDPRLTTEDAASLTVNVETPLRIEVTRTVNLKAGQSFHGKLAEPVYGPDRLLLPAGVEANGIVAATPAAGRYTRVNAKLDGDFTPLRVPVIRVTELVLPSGAVLPIVAEGGMRNATKISLARHPHKTSITGRIKGAIRGQVQQVRDTLHDPHKGDLLKQLLYSQLFYHPQRVWAGSSFDAVLRERMLLPATTATLSRTSTVTLTSGTMQARLISGVTSGSAKKGDAISAVLVAPFCNQQGSMMLSAGTPLTGVVLQARPARSFGRSGRLRFAFRSVGVPAPDSTRADQHIDSSLSSIQALNGQNVALDAEGGARAQPDKGRFLVPLVLGVMAVASQGDDGGIGRQGVTSNGFGLAARVVSIASGSRDVSTGFAAFGFSKSIYRRFIARGHEVSFPQNTELSIDLNR